MSLIAKLINYLKETRAELRHVNWPNRKTTIRLTLLVIGVSFAVAAYLGLFDKIFTSLLNIFIFK
ncbi:MAG: preprotein translocase subunit SecE [Candidatus Tagabacteria bacterium RIFCSPLOWO2_01_FULL_42_9]|uniref:Protein translocase subunit SecE n=1 Tax=Candidatus Tagabacteria bacterium RIFCSPLOWO2_01_FULL_42_9 TaxID=1802296 RepID=A0A1G2LWA4_9BACT|nr:MAG: preprotein translocase subunit SecE [Candidatus Tagabacteria bacterium RIFCSPLOWO2_01_FULL_42_9]